MFHRSRRSRRPLRPCRCGRGAPTPRGIGLGLRRTRCRPRRPRRGPCGAPDGTALTCKSGFPVRLRRIHSQGSVHPDSIRAGSCRESRKRRQRSNAGTVGHRLSCAGAFRRSKMASNCSNVIPRKVAREFHSPHRQEGILDEVQADGPVPLRLVLLETAQNQVADHRHQLLESLSLRGHFRLVACRHQPAAILFDMENQISGRGCCRLVIGRRDAVDMSERCPRADFFLPLWPPRSP